MNLERGDHIIKKITGGLYIRIAEESSPNVTGDKTFEVAEENNTSVTGEKDIQVDEDSSTNVTGEITTKGDEGQSINMTRNLLLARRKKVHRILYYNPASYITDRLGKIDIDLGLCEYQNCKITSDLKKKDTSDVVIFDGQRVKKMFERPKGQLWIFAAHVTPLTIKKGNCWSSSTWRNSFNLIKTYDKYSADIFWPYGEIRRRDNPQVKNFTSIFYNKTKDVLVISSHCPTPSKRENFIKILSKYIDVDVLVLCGKKWTCGRRWYHDDCFKIINQYKFYLSFENALCRGYFTEKFFENFNYDSIMVVRGGIQGEALEEFPEGTFISTDSFKRIRDLGHYLKKLSSSVTEYTKMLERKDQFHYPGYRTFFKETMCRLCDRLNNPDHVSSRIPDIVNRMYTSFNVSS